MQSPLYTTKGLMMAARMISTVNCIPTLGFLLLCLLHPMNGHIREIQEYLPPSLDTARQFLQDYNDAYPRIKEAYSSASWNYQRDMSVENLNISTQETLKASAFEKRTAKYVRVFDNVVETFPAHIRRELKFIRNVGVSALDNDTVAEFYQVQGEMGGNYASARVCRPTNGSDCLRFDPGLKGIMADSTDWDERLWAWKGFRDEVGVPNKPLFARYVDLVNEGARANGYKNRGHGWKKSYGEDLEEKAFELYDAILPLYKQLHAYVRRRLHQVFGDHVDVEGYIPANLLGDMWGSYWVNLYPMMIPYPDRPNIDITQAMVEQGINGTQIFRIANEFFTSLGLLPVNEGFWENSQFVRPDDGREVGCHPSAWDFGNGADFRIAMCAKINMLDFLIAHHEMGHIQYYMQYKDQPGVFRGGANGAFHEAIGEAIFLSVATPKHLQELGFVEDVDQSDKKSDINYLFRNALMTIGSLPFSLGLSKWRWDLMRGVYHVNDSNDVWWKIKNDLLGVEAPIERTNDDFDPGAMYHFVIDYPYIGYYIRTIIQFQFYQALCRAANHTGPLHTCDFYRSEEAGDKLANMLSMGASRPWAEAMEALTGQREMKADAILEYFQPLMEWLEKTNKENGEVIGWPSTSGSTRTARSGNLSSLISLLSVVSIIIKAACQ